VDQILDYITNSDTFDDSKCKALDLFFGIISAFKVSDNICLKLCTYLFNLIFKLPRHSILHNAFLSFFEEIIPKHPNFITSQNVRERIIQEFTYRKIKFLAEDQLSEADITIPPQEKGNEFWMKNFYSQLYKIALIIESPKIKEAIPQNDQWDLFVTSVIQRMTDIIDHPYGGNIPGEDSSESNIQFDSSDDAENYSDEYSNGDEEEDSDTSDEDDDKSIYVYEDRVYGMVEREYEYVFEYKWEAPMEDFALSKKDYPDCVKKEKKLTDVPSEDYIMCAASSLKVAFVALFAALLAALF